MNIIRNNTERSLAVVRGRAEGQFVLLCTVYFNLLIMGLVLVGWLVGWSLAPIARRLSLPVGLVYLFVPLIIAGCLAKATWTRSHRDLKGSQYAFIEVRGAPYKFVGPGGLAWWVWPIQNLSRILVFVEETELKVDETVEIKEVGGSAGRLGHPRSEVILKLGIWVKVINPFRYLYVFEPGGTVEDKTKRFSTYFKGPLQSFVNQAGQELSEDQVMTLTPDQILQGIRQVGGVRFDRTIQGWGFGILRLVIDSREVSGTIKKARELAYEEERKGKAAQLKAKGEAEAFQARMEGLAQGAFGKGLEKLTPEERKELRDFCLIDSSITAIKPTDKTIFGGPATMEQRIAEEMVAEAQKTTKEKER